MTSVMNGGGAGGVDGHLHVKLLEPAPMLQRRLTTAYFNGPPYT